jgi:hypothetical protein
METFNFFNITIDQISKHTASLSHKLYEELSKLRHFNGKKIFESYGKHHLNDFSKQGSILTFNLLNSNGEYIGCK